MISLQLYYSNTLVSVNNSVFYLNIAAAGSGAMMLFQIPHGDKFNANLTKKRDH
ncbi:hypothetical protein PROFUN_10972 [Planoprotostelium fungivorum]|uniref:Uncharacterized protein n=1 Tax=Planoprotostelium fungivorum TaxID=1890364 RepID=A0A2P6NBY6_9EUKA|nr:hypothetical protein PROFUN_10972 [Planoprotostelium fungivorum]